ncbi:hypothetical protein WA026_006511 [Henosepilachna vigintioctopunctata]|uniref:Uncharacterized protein n=1 Tax=Henosepilachna vigintioctopunctata TaxID=420089 RepID=A0AAW1UF79_9CUCU
MDPEFWQKGITIRNETKNDKFIKIINTNLHFFNNKIDMLKLSSGNMMLPSLVSQSTGVVSKLLRMRICRVSGWLTRLVDHLVKVLSDKETILRDDNRSTNRDNKVGALKQAVEATQTISNVRRDSHSKGLWELLRRHLRGIYTEIKKNENAKFIASVKNQRKSISRLIKRETGKNSADKRDQSTLTADKLNDYFSTVALSTLKQVIPKDSVHSFNVYVSNNY